MDPFDPLPNELIFLQDLELEIRSITNLCQTSRRFNRLICENDLFWYYKFIRDYRFNPVQYTGSWNQLYREYQSVWSFGYNSYGQLGLGDQVSRLVSTQNFKAKAISSGTDHTLLIDLDDNVWSFGWNHHGQLGLGDNYARFVPTRIPNFKAKAISCGRDHTFFIAILVL